MPIRPSSEQIDFGDSALVADQVGIREIYRSGVHKVTTSAGSTQLHGVLEQAVTLSGTTTSSTIQIPADSIILAVSAKVTTAITATGSPTSWCYGVSGNATQFGNLLTFTAGTTNAGVIGPTGFYTATSILISPVGGSTPSFTGGVVRLTIHYIKITAPTS